jgi:alkanesulfonate monooxygenase SsuD/methylene tetrahydromethanopterin reductase-like flavin-dependent oxidoreductase (luciferase family)
MHINGAPSAARFGLFLNNRGAVIVGERYTLATLLALAVRAEELGFDFVSVGDSVLAKPRYAPVPTLAAVAAVTTRIELTTGVLQPHLRPPVQFAQEWATLDALSGGRTSLGVGLGSGSRELVAAELSLAGLSHSSRAAALEESITVLRALWSGSGPVTFPGRFWNLTDVNPGYRPVRPGGVPILIACGTYVPETAGAGPVGIVSPDAAGAVIGPVGRVARLGDGWISGILRPEEWAVLWARLRVEGEAVGRDLAAQTFERRFNTYIHVGNDRGAARREGKHFMEAYHRLPLDDATLDRWLIYGSAADCAARLSELIDAGVNSFQFVLASDDQMTQLERLAETLRGFVPGKS